MWRPYGLRSLLLIPLAALAFPLTSVAQVGTCTTAGCWSYSGKTNPAYWGGLTPYAYCNPANNPSQQQSPIDVMPGAGSPVPVNTSLTLSTHYSSTAVPVEDLGYTIEADYGTGSSQNSVTFNGVTYNLLQFHFHQVSEHTINYQVTNSFPMEVHLVHQAADANGTTDPNGAKLVIGVLINAPTGGAANQGFADVMTALSSHNHPMQNIAATQMLPGGQNSSSLTFFTYMGSLTTPPCTPGITWVVLANQINFSPAQVGGYKYPNSSRLLQAPISNTGLQSNFTCQYCTTSPKPQ